MAHHRNFSDVTANAGRFHKFLNLVPKTGQNALCLAAFPTANLRPFCVLFHSRLFIYLANPRIWPKIGTTR